MPIRFHFYLANKQSDLTPARQEDTWIFLQGRKKGIVYKWAVGEKIKPDDWSFVAERPRRTYLRELRDRLDLIQKYAETIDKEYAQSGLTLTPKVFRGRMNARFPKDHHIIPSAIADLRSSVIDALEVFLRNPIHPTKPGQKLSPNTVKQHNTLLNHLINFRTISGHPVSFETMDREFGYKFEVYLRDRVVTTSGGGIAKYFSTLRSFLNKQARMGKKINSEYLHWQVRAPMTAAIALTQSELKDLSGLELEGRQEVYRDAFLFCCDMGLEFSAIKTMNPEQWVKETTIDGKVIQYLTYQRAKKQGDPDVIACALRPTALELLDKYPDGFPRLSNPVFNRELKVLGQMAGITSRPPELQGREKWEAITTHTGRRTFVTLRMAEGWSWEKISAYTGHTTMKMVKNYERLNTDGKVRKSLGG